METLCPNAPDTPRKTIARTGINLIDRTALHTEGHAIRSFRMNVLASVV
jgi:hypothetical protein